MRLTKDCVEVHNWSREQLNNNCQQFGHVIIKDLRYIFVNPIFEYVYNNWLASAVTSEVV